MTTTPFSPVELDRRVDAALAALRNRNASPRPSPRVSDSVRQRVSEGVVRHHARKVACDPEASPLRRARYERGWSMRALANHAGLGSINTVLAAETRPAQTSRLTWARLSRALGIPVDAIRPDADWRPRPLGRARDEVARRGVRPGS